jgi:hypothetical protein
MYGVGWGFVHFGSEADMCSARGYVRFTPNSGHVRCIIFSLHVHAPICLVADADGIAELDLAQGQRERNHGE